LAVSAASAHYVLDYPTRIGFDDEKLDQAPCGSFDPTDRSAGVTKWSIGGSNIAVTSTHARVRWQFNVALVSDPTRWLPLVKEFGQTGVGNVCFKGVPGISAWANQQAVLQVIQYGHDGVLYQCAAIEIVAGGPDPVPNSCKNSNGISIDSLVPAPVLPAPVGSSSSSSLTATGA
ncbi:hypothetical protein B0H67DRAFT_468260, partial [Lasiosphaeris hirsuta]